ncbi:MAG: undecaprenyl/decaprenyl-phosphate alpha-N-acetylglucosaminyl 1-phosphate transferase [Phycisphaerales bacterium]|nr:undecaprenyl/decaprenyl-phosphate alpha-N-acetylglucosaminyl 1-phosphate transferase [Phycisphaerales bacterium]
MLLAALSLVLIGLAISVPLTALLVKCGPKLGAMDTVGSTGHAKVLRGVPNIGGVAIIAALAGPMLIGLAAIQWAPQALVGAIPEVADHLPHLSESLPTGWAFLAALLVIHVMGVVDDRRPLKALHKALVQAALALILAIWFDVRVLTMLGQSPLGQVLSVALTVIWIVAVCNAVNFMDNMDGLAGGVAAIAAALFLAATLVNEQWFIAACLALLVGGLAGFLLFNFPYRAHGGSASSAASGARIFMGDGGSLPVGYALGVLTARTTFVDPTDPTFALGSAWYGIFMPLLVMAVPLYDLIAVSLLRIREGRSPFVGDQRHLSHRLVGHGLTKRQAVLVIWALAAITGIGGVMLGGVAPWQAALIGAQTLIALGVLALVERAIER